MFRFALILFVAGIASALVGLGGGEGVVPSVARVGFYVLVPIAVLAVFVGLLRGPRRAH
jgi:uncharacterized membrane protein YtjA (UPF0391 family)